MRPPAEPLRTGLAVLLAIGMLVALRCLSASSGTAISHRVLAANGAAVSILTAVFPDTLDDLSAVTLETEHGLLRVGRPERDPQHPRSWRFPLIAGTRPGTETVRLRGGGLDLKLVVHLRAEPVDSDGDGFPDAAELADPTDRERFAAWFCAIAESQFYGYWDAWIPEQRDCAGLVRFAWREALMRHDPAWFARTGGRFSFTMPDVAAFRHPEIPFLGDRLFRVRPPGGLFRKEDFAAFADARHLMAYNVVPVSGGTDTARPGDLLFFANDDLDLDDPADRMHIMVWLGERSGSAGERGPMLVYHTGDRKSGEVRRTTLEVLLAHPDPRWRPLSGNPSFLGVLRPAIVD